MKHIVALSGGKDSTALALALQIYEPRDYVFIANPTGNELPEMFDHLLGLEQRLQAPIQHIGADMSFEQLMYREQMIPNFRARFCTRILKIEPTQEYINTLKDTVLYVGLRADEQSRKGADYGVKCRFPMQEWGWNLQDVWSFLHKNKIKIPKRTDCAWCFYQRIDEWWYLWRNYPKYWMQGERIEHDLGHTFRTPGKDKWPTAMKDMRKMFSKGHAPKKAPMQRKMTEMCTVCGL